MGTEARVAIAEDLVLDFSGLFTGEPPEKEKEAPESSVEPFLEAGKYKNHYRTTKARRRPARGLRGTTG